MCLQGICRETLYSFVNSTYCFYRVSVSRCKTKSYAWQHPHVVERICLSKFAMYSLFPDFPIWLTGYLPVSTVSFIQLVIWIRLKNFLACNGFHSVFCFGIDISKMEMEQGRGNGEGGKRKGRGGGRYLLVSCCALIFWCELCSSCCCYRCHCPRCRQFPFPLPTIPVWHGKQMIKLFPVPRLPHAAGACIQFYSIAMLACGAYTWCFYYHLN